MWSITINYLKLNARHALTVLLVYRRLSYMTTAFTWKTSSRWVFKNNSSMYILVNSAAETASESFWPDSPQGCWSMQWKVQSSPDTAGASWGNLQDWSKFPLGKVLQQFVTSLWRWLGFSHSPWLKSSESDQSLVSAVQDFLARSGNRWPRYTGCAHRHSPGARVPTAVTLGTGLELSLCPTRTVTSLTLAHGAQHPLQASRLTEAVEKGKAPKDNQFSTHTGR